MCVTVVLKTAIFTENKMQSNVFLIKSLGYSEKVICVAVCLFLFLFLLVLSVSVKMCQEAEGK